MSTTPYFRTLAGIGNLGVGTTSPTSNLQVVGNAYVSNALSTTNVLATTMNTGTMNVTSIAVSGSTATTGYVLSSTSSGTGLAWISPPSSLSGLSTNGILYATSATSAATVATHVYSGGNVGIGTAGPTSNLHVYGSSTSNIQMIINNVANAGGSNYSAFVHSDQAYCGGVGGAGQYTYSGASLLVTSYPNNTANNSGYTVYFGTSASDTTSLAPQMVIKAATGYVGIGVASPTTALQVSGTVTATTFSGSGASLTSLPMGQASGTLAVANGGTGTTTSTGSGSVVLSAGPTLTGTVTAGTFSGSGASLTSIPMGQATGTLAVANGGTGTTTSTGTGSVVLSASPTLTGTLAASSITASSGIYASLNTNAGGAVINAQNVNAGSSAYSAMQWQTDTGSAYIFKNSSTRTTDGGVKTCTFRNDDGDLKLAATGNSPFIYLQASSGNVGIGQASPSYKLSVDNGSTTGPAAFVQASGITAGQNMSFILGKVNSTNNAGTILWNHVGDGLSTNYLGLGYWGGDNKLNITAAGNVGIGLTNPSSTLDIRGGNISFGSYDTTSAVRYVGIYNVNDGNGCLAGMEIENTTLTGNYSQKLHFRTHWYGTNNGRRLTIAEGGNVGIGITNPTSYTLQVAGTIGASGDITALYSDERLKTKTGALTGALDKVASLDTFTYRNNELAQSFGFKDDYQRVGVSAQQVQKVLPEAVRPAPFDAENQSGQNYLTVQYEKLVPLLIEALKEERRLRCQLEERVAALESASDQVGKAITNLV